MKAFYQTVRYLLFIVIVQLYLYNCSSNTPVAGTGTETSTKGVVAGSIIDNNGNIGIHTLIQLIPDSYNAVIDGPIPDSLCDTTDAFGTYTFKKIKPGNYSILATQLETKNRALIHGILVAQDTQTIRAASLQKTGAMRVVQPDSTDVLNGYLYIPGTTIFSFFNNNGFTTLHSVPAGTIHALCYSSIVFAKQKTLRHDIQVGAGDTVTVSNLALQFAKRLYLNTTTTGANISTNIFDFPVLIRLTKDNFNFKDASNDGREIRFSKANGEPLPYEIERWDPVDNQADIWVKVDTVFYNNNTQSIIMYWGASPGLDAVSLSNGTAVFDTTYGFQGVWHMNQPSGALVLDASGNHFNGTPSPDAPSLETGVIGFAQSFNGTTNYLDIKNTADGKLNFIEKGNYTISAWVNSNPTKSGWRYGIVSKGWRQYTFQLHENGYANFNEVRKAGGWEETEYPVSDTTWHYIVGVRDGAKMSLWVDGNFTDSTWISLDTTVNRTESHNVNIGAVLGKTSTSGSPSDFFDGKIDEVQIANRARSADWIRLSFINQSTPDKLIIWK